MLKNNDVDKPKKNWFNFDKMIKRQKKRKIIPCYTFPTGTEIIGLMIKSQNKKLLLEIAKDKNMSPNATEELLNLFLKPCYFLPQVTRDKHKENMHYKIIKNKQ